MWDQVTKVPMFTALGTVTLSEIVGKLRVRHYPPRIVVVRRDDGPLVRYVVTGTRRYAKKAFPTETVYGRSPDSTLRLVTCGGPYDGDYHDNVVVFARLSS